MGTPHAQQFHNAPALKVIEIKIDHTVMCLEAIGLAR